MTTVSKHKFRISYSKTTFIHKAIANCAFGLKEKILKKEQEGAKEGLAHDYWSCLIFIAYWQEALLNYFFSVKPDLAPKLDKFPLMLNVVAAHIRMDFSKGSDNRKLLYELREIRNGTAHGKPITKRKGVEIEGTFEEAEQKAKELDEDWFDDIMKPDFLNTQYNLTEALEESILEALGIDYSAVATGSVTEIKQLA
ncbi:hypothetical protein [Paenochrobactrum glaciei]|uniref:RiboL-PSP-HEPN domain-containing protein n=1 Tax=Paenochrobactrum glaciei TaxID=486407 RepID=A0ABP3QZK3_9HYPH